MRIPSPQTVEQLFIPMIEYPTKQVAHSVVAVVALKKQVEQLPTTVQSMAQAEIFVSKK
jgi:hypothetical protein